MGSLNSKEQNSRPCGAVSGLAEGEEGGSTAGPGSPPVTPSLPVQLDTGQQLRACHGRPLVVTW